MGRLLSCMGTKRIAPAFRRLLTRALTVVPVIRSCTKTSLALFVSPATKLVASLEKVTYRPLDEIDGEKDEPSDCTCQGDGNETRDAEEGQEPIEGLTLIVERDARYEHLPVWHRGQEKTSVEDPGFFASL